MSDQSQSGSFQLSDLARLVKRLPPGTLGQFEPLSGIIVLNMDKTSFNAMSERMAAGSVTEADRFIVGVINHESCHFLQTCISGYMFDRARRLMAALNSEDCSAALQIDALEKQTEELINQHRDAFADDPSLMKRFADLVIMDYYTQRRAIFSDRSRGDPGTRRRDRR